MGSPELSVISSFPGQALPWLKGNDPAHPRNYHSQRVQDWAPEASAVLAQVPPFGIPQDHVCGWGMYLGFSASRAVAGAKPWGTTSDVFFAQ